MRTFHTLFNSSFFIIHKEYYSSVQLLKLGEQQICVNLTIGLNNTLEDVPK